MKNTYPIERKQVVVISSLENGNYFFSTNHCQEHGLDDSYVPCTYTLPMFVQPRPILPNGIVYNIETLVSIFYDDMVEIENPDVNFKFNKF